MNFKIGYRMTQHEKSCHALTVLLPDLIAPLDAKIFPAKLVLRVPNTTPRNPPFYSFASFSIVWVTPFINKPESSKDLTIFIASCLSLFHNPRP